MEAQPQNFSVTRKRIMIERRLINGIIDMEGSLDSNNLEDARRIYQGIKNSYARVSVSIERKYHDKIVRLYQRALGFNQVQLSDLARYSRREYGFH